MPSLLEIDPASITKDNIPSILGAIVTELRAINQKIDDGIKQDLQTALAIDARLQKVEQTLDSHEKMFWGPIKISKCHVIPFLKNNKYVVTLFFAAATFWLSAVDYIVRAVQWAFQPPFKP